MPRGLENRRSEACIGYSGSLAGTQEIDDSGAPASLAKVHSLTSLASWLLAGKVTSFALSVILPLLLVRRLSKIEFGLYKQAFLVVGTAIQTLPLGFQMSAYYFLPREPQHRGQVVFNVLLWHALTSSLALVALLFYPPLLNLLFKNPDLEQYAALIGTVIALWGVSYFLEAAVVANQESHLAAVFIIVAQFSKTLFMVSAAASFATLHALLIAAICQGVAQTALLIGYLNWRFPGFWRRFDRTLLWRQLSYAIPFGLAGVLWTLETDYHNYFVSAVFGPAMFAIYAIGCLDIPLVSLLSESVGSVMIPRAAALQRENNHRELLLVTVRAMRKLALAFFPIYAFLMVEGRDFIIGAFTANYAASWPLFAVNLTLLPFATVLTDPLVRAYAEQRFFMIRFHLALFAAMVIGLWLATRRFGMLSAVVVIVGVNVAGRLWIAARMARVVGVRREDWKLLEGYGKVALAAVASAVLTAGFRLLLPPLKPLLTVTVCGLFFSAAYLIALVWMNIPEPDEYDLIRRFAAKLVPSSAAWGKGEIPR
jgi:O-antigen/teichoic acid export membrane protein